MNVGKALISVEELRQS